MDDKRISSKKISQRHPFHEDGSLILGIITYTLLSSPLLPPPPHLPPISRPRAPLSSSTLENRENAFKRNLEKGVEMKVKVVEAKFQEEKLKLQQKHDDDVQKILERKNQEIEEMRVQYR